VFDKYHVVCQVNEGVEEVRRFILRIPADDRCHDPGARSDRVLLGPHWAPAVPVLRILAPIGLLQSLTTITGQIYMATGATRAMFRWGTLFSAVLVAGFVQVCPGASWGWRPFMPC